MHVESYGTGSNAFLGIHGWAGNHRTFRPLIPFLPDDASLHCVDLPGYGASPRPTSWTLQKTTDALAETIRAVSANPVTLIGYCGGGNLALLAALNVPDHVARVVLIDTFAYMPLYFKVFTWGTFGRRAYLTTFGNSLGRRLTNAALRGKRTSTASLTHSFEKIDHDLTVEVLRAFRAVPHWTAFADLVMPIDVVWGERSFAAAKTSVAIWRSIWPHARPFQLDGAGHSPLVEATGQVVSILFDQGAHATHPETGTQVPNRSQTQSAATSRYRERKLT